MPDSSRPRVDARAVAAVAAGALVGGPLRYGLEELTPTADHGFPWATLVINVSGSFFLAVLLVTVVETAWSVRYLREFAGIGLIGSYTTFSTSMLELRDQAARSEWGPLAAYLGGSIILGLGAAALGMTAARIATRRRR
jgi:fluoride exporter